MKAPYSKTFEVKWADLDPNFHLRGSVYFDFTDQTRFSYFQNNGLPVTKWRELGLGPVILEQTIRYKKEVFLEEKVTVEFRVAYASEDHRIFKIQHQLWKGEGILVAEVEVTVGLLNLTTRKLAPAPPAFIELLKQTAWVQ